MKRIIRNGSRAVAISSNDESGPYHLSLYVNVPRDMEDRFALSCGDITNISATLSTMRGAEKRAARMLS